MFNRVEITILVSHVIDQLITVTLINIPVFFAARGGRNYFEFLVVKTKTLILVRNTLLVAWPFPTGL